MRCYRVSITLLPVSSELMNHVTAIGRKFSPTLHIMRSLWVQNARSLEKFKTTGVPNEVYENGKYMVFLKGTDHVLLDPATKTIAWKTTESLSLAKDSNWLKIVLDVVEQNPETCLFAVDLPGEIANNLDGKFYDARKALFILDSQESALVSQARGLINFCLTTKFCKSCGGSLSTSEAGTQKKCDGCQRTHYPTLSPVGIVLIEDKSHNKVLLVRGARHPRGMFSCVAGFIEPGESLEQNIRREVAEEVGLDVDNIEFFASQHWAMPESQLMLGCIATAISEDYDLDPTELDGGKWVDAITLADAVTRSKAVGSAPNPAMLWVPPPSAVAHTLMEHWLKRYHTYTPLTSRI